MRRYKIQILEPGGNSVIQEWKSYDETGKKNLAGALNIELDVPVSTFAQSAGISWIRVWGIPLKMIGAASDFTFKNIKVWAGFSPVGYPLAKPKQYNLLFSGWIVNSFGNWQGNEMTLDLYAAPGTAPSSSVDGGIGTDDSPKNISLNWLKGQTLESALRTTLSVAFPKYAAKYKLDSSIVAQEDMQEVFRTIDDLAFFVDGKSKDIKGDKTYQGAQIYVSQDTISVTDYSQAPNTKTAITFPELIGQPTYGSPSGYEIQFTTPLRGDLNVLDAVTLPSTLFRTTNSAQSGILQQTGALPKNKSIFNGTFLIKGVRHVGNFRSSDDNAWVTIIDALLNTSSLS